MDLLHRRAARGDRALAHVASGPAGDRFRQLALRPRGGRRGRSPRSDAQRTRVMDFLDVGVGALRWPTFNRADIRGKLWRDRAGDFPLAGGFPPARNGDVGCLADLSPSVATAPPPSTGTLPHPAARLADVGDHRQRRDCPNASWLPRSDQVYVRFPEDEPPRTLRPPRFHSPSSSRRAPRRHRHPRGLVVHPAPGHRNDPHRMPSSRGALRYPVARRASRHRATGSTRHVRAHGCRQDRPCPPAARRRHRGPARPPGVCRPGVVA